MCVSRFVVTATLLVVIFTVPSLVLSSNDDLKAVVAVFRHGDRAPLKPYTLDPYDETYWPLGLGQLTNLGKKQAYSLGQWLRARYADYLPSTYNRADIKVQSSNVDRCLMTAESVLAGLYPPEGAQVWNKDLKWQPIPVHTLPEEDDPVVAQGKPCPKYSKLYAQLLETEPFSLFLDKYQDRMQYYSEQSGDNVTTLQDLKQLYNIVHIENVHNFTLPEWASTLFNEDMDQVIGMLWSSYAYYKELAKLRAGPLIDYIFNHFHNVLNGGDQAFALLSGHDTTVATLMTAMGVFDYEWPEYASTVLLELRKTENSTFVNVLHKNSTDLVEVLVPQCNFNCELEELEELLAPVRAAEKEWEALCDETVDDLNVV
ncbi:hypothetical protein NQ315_000178 [Exocentrus adspersus]|uniref:acid phosphatase n=1 Tax=Exocentrus adspersus TaxID=1586481 RepID=A0AAV8VRE9_9CUCU|nr:hypothetical protein NQ315_000178 [Exocentrus adspersus]